MMLSKETQIQDWENELARAEAKRAEAVHYDNQGELAWCDERIRWAAHKLSMLERGGVA